MSAALRMFVETVNATGGVIPRRGAIVPLADPEWSDLGAAYMEACRELGIAPNAQQVQFVPLSRFPQAEEFVNLDDIMTFGDCDVELVTVQRIRVIAEARDLTELAAALAPLPNGLLVDLCS